MIRLIHKYFAVFYKRSKVIYIRVCLKLFSYKRRTKRLFRNCGKMRCNKLLSITVLLNVFICGIWILKNYKSKEIKIENCPKLISVIQGGNLGNCIFEYMSLFAVANLYKETNLQPYCTYGLRVVLEKCFESLSIPGKLPNVPENCSYSVKTNYIWPVQKPISLQGITELNTSITLDMYSARYEDIIKYGIDKMKVELRFKEEHILYSNKLFVSLKTKFNLENEDVTFVGMHYRGTDYIHHLKLIYKKYKPPPNYKYYKEAMTYFEKNYKNIIFILITIDDEWLNENLPNIRNNANLIVNPNDGDPVRDLVILSHCNHSIINYGTFGTAAALLNKGTTFVYDLNMPLDYRGTTIAMGIAQLLPNWHVL